MKLSRIIRFVEPGVLPPKMAAQYDEKNNLMYVDKWIYEHTSVHYQTKMLMSNNDVVVD